MSEFIKLHENFKNKLDILKEHFTRYFDKNGVFNLARLQDKIMANGGGLVI